MDPLQFLGTMGENPVPVIAAFFIGLMTAISPCPLATNITAIAYISKQIESGRHTLLTGFVYTLGRMTAYIAVASVIVLFGMNLQFVAFLLQMYGEQLIGPFLVLCGIFLLGVFSLDRLPGGTGSPASHPLFPADLPTRDISALSCLGWSLRSHSARSLPSCSLPCSSRLPSVPATR